MRVKDDAKVPDLSGNTTAVYLVLAMIGVVGVVGLVSVWNTTTGAMNFASNPGFASAPYKEDAFYCRYDADCAFNEICANSRRPNNWATVCQPSHTCGRDWDCQGLGTSPSLMQCVNGWCKHK